MREALAQINNDFVLAEPREARRPRKTKGRAGFLQKSRSAAYFAAKHANVFMGLLFAGLLAAVLANALFWQKSPHPAPLFGHSISIEAKVEPRVEPKPETKTAEPKHDTPPAPASVRAAAMAELAAPPAERPVQTATPHGRDPMAEVAELQSQKPSVPRDPIAQLLKRPAAAPSPEPSKTVLAAQRALVRLGFVVKPDGVMRPATRQALEQFERDHNLPVHGSLSPKIMRELTAQSGIAVE